MLRALCEPRDGTFGVLDDALGLSRAPRAAARAPIRGAREPAAARTTCDRRGEGVAGVLGDLLASGDDVLIACGEPRRWRRGLDATLAGLARGPRGDRVVGPARAASRARRAVPARVRARPAARRRCRRRSRPALPGAGFAHCGWGPGEEAVARAAVEARAGRARDASPRVYRALREAAPAALGELEPVLDPIAPRADCALRAARAARAVAGADRAGRRPAARRAPDAARAVARLPDAAWRARRPRRRARRACRRRRGLIPAAGIAGARG